jgi:hypothetical protein
MHLVYGGLSSFDPTSLRILGLLDELERTLNTIAMPSKALIRARNNNNNKSAVQELAT